MRRLLLLLLVVVAPFPFPPRRGKEAATAVALARAARNSATHSPQAQHERRKKAAEAEGVPSQPRSSQRCISAASLSSSSQLRGKGKRWPPRLAAAGADLQRLRDGLGAGQLCGKKIKRAALEMATPPSERNGHSPVGAEKREGGGCRPPTFGTSFSHTPPNPSSFTGWASWYLTLSLRFGFFGPFKRWNP